MFDKLRPDEKSAIKLFSARLRLLDIHTWLCWNGPNSETSILKQDKEITEFFYKTKNIQKIFDANHPGNYRSPMIYRTVMHDPLISPYKNLLFTLPINDKKFNNLFRILASHNDVSVIHLTDLMLSLDEKAFNHNIGIFKRKVSYSILHAGLDFPPSFISPEFTLFEKDFKEKAYDLIINSIDRKYCDACDQKGSDADFVSAKEQFEELYKQSPADYTQIHHREGNHYVGFDKRTPIGFFNENWSLLARFMLLGDLIKLLTQHPNAGVLSISELQRRMESGNDTELKAIVPSVIEKSTYEGAGYSSFEYSYIPNRTERFEHNNVRFKDREDIIKRFTDEHLMNMEKYNSSALYRSR